MKLVICEKPSVAKAVASALGVTPRADGCFEGNGLIVSWCVGHLVSPMDAAGYDPGYLRVYDPTGPEQVAAYLYENGVTVRELKTDKIGLEEYYIDLMDAKGVR